MPRSHRAASKTEAIASETDGIRPFTKIGRRRGFDLMPDAIRYPGRIYIMKQRHSRIVWYDNSTSSRRDVKDEEARA